MKIKRSKPSEQIDKFKETARALECDESEEAFDKALGKIGRPSTEVSGRQKRPK